MADERNTSNVPPEPGAKPGSGRRARAARAARPARAVEGNGLWDRPQLLNLISDVLMVVGAAGLGYAAVAALSRLPAFPLREVVVMTPLAQVTNAQLEYVARSSLRGNFFTVDLDDVRASFEKLPWVRKVYVRRQWPDRLEVRIEEHKPVARWGEGRGELVNSYGEVFATSLPEQEAGAMPLLFGPLGTAPEVLKEYGELVGAFKSVGETPLQVTLSPRLAWQLKLQNGMLVDIGREQPKSPVGVRLARFIEVYPEMVAKRAVRPAVVDLRYPNGFAMRVAAEGKGK